MPVSGRPVADGRHKLRDEQTHRVSYSTLGVLKTTEVAYERACPPTRPSHPP
jgi:hypothetical protein